MIKRTLYFGNAVYLSIRNKNLIVSYPESDADKKANIEDIGVVILDHSQITVTQPTLNALLQNNVAVLTCNDKHLPQGLFLNLNGHHKQQEHWHTQVAVSDAKKSRLWKQLVKAKINNQASIMVGLGYNTDNMLYWADAVKNGDPKNYEARAAAYYWKHVFTDYVSGFKRGRFEADPNHLLNYGYAILRAIVARSLVASGLLPTFGVHHRNSYNAYCLADDVMEPYRPFVDGLVLEMLKDGLGFDELNTETKQRLLQIPVFDVKLNKKTSPLMLAVQRTTASLYACYAGEKKKLVLPVLQ